MEQDGHLQQDPCSPSAPFDYLLRMPLHSLTQERYQALCDRAHQLQQQVLDLERKSPQDLWLEDLDALEGVLVSFPGYEVPPKSDEADGPEVLLSTPSALLSSSKKERVTTSGKRKSATAVASGRSSSKKGDAGKRSKATTPGRGSSTGASSKKRADTRGRKSTTPTGGSSRGASTKESASTTGRKPGTRTSQTGKTGKSGAKGDQRTSVQKARVKREGV